MNANPEVQSIEQLITKIPVKKRYVEDFSYAERAALLKAYMNGDGSMPVLAIEYGTSSGTVACLLHAQAMLEGKYGYFLQKVVSERYHGSHNKMLRGK